MESFLNAAGAEQRVNPSNPLPVTSAAPAATLAVGAVLGALNASCSQTPSGNGTMVVQVTGSFVGAISLQGTVDGTNYVTFGSTPQFLNLNTGAYTATITAAGVYQTSANGLAGSKLVMSSYTSGSATVSTSLSAPAAMLALDAALPAGGNKIGSADVASLPTPTTQSYAIAASTNSQVPKGSAGTLYYAEVFNATGAVAYLHLFDKATAPTLGTDIPKQVIPCQPGVLTSVNFGNLGTRYSNGIAAALTAGAADLDATVLTAAGGRMVVSFT